MSKESINTELGIMHSEFRTCLEGSLGNSEVLCLKVMELSKDPVPCQAEMISLPVRLQ